ncbi:haloacid dehalogenase-like hydrolase [Planctomonas sp. JC2975]|uniref:HAD family hydrolase n=1 Tax=Planctomonas sp. JC2975 TaxID=2729626 RepID=UPI001475C232|nr:HAD family hydrolase [Planctomonas sp. JC2975]NNC11084.1 haloacid dehalogenase-like hydrolase [Planctomonas sp. JC2975]
MADLASWRDGPTKRRIEEFVEAVTSGDHPVPVEDRVAVFDNDGTLWTEKPMQTEIHYIVEQWTAIAEAKPELADTQPYKAVVSGDLSWLAGAIDKNYAGDDSDLKVMIRALVGNTAGMNVEDYAESVADFFRTARHPTLNRPYRDVVFAPMVELLAYLAEHGFTCYIASAGDRDFMRPITQDFYGVPFERVIGSAVGLEYKDGEVLYAPSFDFFNDGPEKPVRLWSRIGRRPLFAAGNSNGDLDMLAYVRTNPRGFGLLVHHDDDTGRGDPAYDTGAEKALAAAAELGLAMVSIKEDWAKVYSRPVGTEASAGHGDGGARS